MNTFNNGERKKQERQDPSWIKTERTSLTTTKKPSWQVARDISKNILSRKSTKLIVKQETTPYLTRPQSVTTNHSLQETTAVSKSSPLNRIPRMPTEKEAVLADIAYRLICSCCNGPCIDEYIRCRVCIKTCHSQCLLQRGYVTNQSVPLRRLAKPNWSCPDCRDLTRLLNHDEILYLIHAYDLIDRNKDGYIVLDEFLSLQYDKTMPDGLELFVQHNYDLAKRYFSLMDSRQKGVVAWSDFVLLYSCKLIAVKDKIELTTKLTEKELVTARNLFLKDPRKSFDNDYNRIITREHFNRVHHDLISSLNKKYGIDFIDAILSYDYHIDNTSEKPPVMLWPEFLREIALLILLNRSNDDVRSSQALVASIPAHLSNEVTVLRPNFPSDVSRRLSLTRSHTSIRPIFPNASCDKLFINHAKVLEKLNQRNRSEEFKGKKMNSSFNFTILESVDEKQNINLPKLKPNARDDRKTIIDPWTSVNEMQRLRNEPILVKPTRMRMLKT